MAANKRAFEKFYNEHFDKLYRFVFFRTGKDEQLAQDLVSEIFMKVLQHFEQYDEQRSKTSWLMTIARNHLANYWRDTKPTESLVKIGEDGETEDESLWIKGSLEAWQKSEAEAQIVSLLAKIRPEEREIVTFHYIFGYTYAEIAQMKGLSEGAAKVIAHRAIKKMREDL